MGMEEILLSQRLHNQRLAAEQFGTAAETVGWMGAVQGQDYNPSIWGIGIRTAGLTKKDIEQAIAEMKIVRSWTMRHTIHFVSMEDLAWVVALSKERMLRMYANHMEKDAGLTEATLQQASDVFQEALQGKRLIARPALRQILEDAGIDTTGQRYYHLLWYAAQIGLIFIGPMEGKQQTFGLVEEWGPKSNLTRDEALKKMTIRYLTSHGPATPHDFAWWAGLTVGDAKKGFELVKEQLYVEGNYWSASPFVEREVGSPTLQLLPTLDEFLIGYKDRSAALPEDSLLKIDPLKQGFFFPLLLDGKVVGSWRANVKKKSLVMAYKVLSDVTIAEDLLASKAQDYAHFFDLVFEAIQLERF